MPTAITQAMTENDPMSGVSLISYVVGTAFSWLGGYVCARVAQETELRCAAVVAAVSGASRWRWGPSCRCRCTCC